MTLLETILIIYILLSWFLTIMFITLPRRIINKVFLLLFIIICPPLSIVYIGQLIIKKTKERKKTKEKENERRSSNQFQCKS